MVRIRLLKHLFVIDAQGIQKYVGLSDRLRHILAGSALVSSISSLPQDSLDAVWAGGKLLFLANPEDGKVAVSRITRELANTAPGIEPVVAVVELQNDKGARAALKAMGQALSHAKASNIPNRPLLGLGVTAACQETGLPVAGMGFSPQMEDIRWVTNEILARENQEVHALLGQEDSDLLENVRKKIADEEVWGRAFGELIPKFATEFDKMGRTSGTESRLGVIHIDGDEMGMSIAKWFDSLHEDDKDVWAAYSKLALDIDSKAKDAVYGAIADLIRMGIRFEEGKCRVGTKDGSPFALHTNKDEDEVYLPFRVMYQEGDDIDIVADGRIALWLSARILYYLQKSPLLEEMTASAGVAFGHPHTPYATLRTMAHNQCARAKAKRRNESLDKACWISWGFEGVQEASLLGGPIPLSNKRDDDWTEGDVSLSWAFLRASIDPAKNGSIHSSGGDAKSLAKSKRRQLLDVLVDEDWDFADRLLSIWLKQAEGEVFLPGEFPLETKKTLRKKSNGPLIRDALALTGHITHIPWEDSPVES